MGVFDKFLDIMKLNEDDYDDLYDEYDEVDTTTMMSMKKSHVIVSLERKIIAARKTAIKILM